MRRKTNRFKSDVIIDLTSLLDVIFIILLVVLCGQSSMKKDLTQLQSEAENAQIKADEIYQLYKEQIEVADNLNQYVWAVSIIVPYDENEITRRQIRFLKEGEEIETINLVGNDVTNAVETFKKSLTKYIKENEDRPVILSLNENDDYILYRDEVMVLDILHELASNFSNVYIKGSISEEMK